MTPERAPILVVEDDAVLAGLLSGHLEARGHVVVRAASAEDARAQLAHGLRPWLVLLDINLPGDSGWSLLRDGPLAGPDRPPVLVMSAGHVSPARLREFDVAGYLPKPFSMHVLLDWVERLGRGQTWGAGVSAEPLGNGQAVAHLAEDSERRSPRG